MNKKVYAILMSAALSHSVGQVLAEEEVSVESATSAEVEEVTRMDVVPEIIALARNERPEGGEFPHRRGRPGFGGMPEGGQHGGQQHGPGMGFQRGPGHGRGMDGPDAQPMRQQHGPGRGRPQEHGENPHMPPMPDGGDHEFDESDHQEQGPDRGMHEGRPFQQGFGPGPGMRNEGPMHRFNGHQGQGWRQRGEGRNFRSEMAGPAAHGSPMRHMMQRMEELEQEVEHLRHQIHRLQTKENKQRRRRHQD